MGAYYLVSTNASNETLCILVLATPITCSTNDDVLESCSIHAIYWLCVSMQQTRDVRAGTLQEMVYVRQMYKQQAANTAIEGSWEGATAKAASERPLVSCHV